MSIPKFIYPLTSLQTKHPSVNNQLTKINPKSNIHILSMSKNYNLVYSIIYNTQ